MGVGKVAAEIGGGIATKKVVDNVLDNKGDNKTLGKTAVSVGAGVAAAKVIDDVADKDVGVGTVVAAGAAGAAVKVAMDKKQEAEAKEQARKNPFEKYQATSANNKQAENSSFQNLMKQQQQSIQQEINGKGMGIEAPGMEPEYTA